MPANLDEMRDGLQRRGLIDEQRRLTPAGNEYCRRVLRELARGPKRKS